MGMDDLQVGDEVLEWVGGLVFVWHVEELDVLVEERFQIFDVLHDVETEGVISRYSQMYVGGYFG